MAESTRVYAFARHDCRGGRAGCAAHVLEDLPELRVGVHAKGLNLQAEATRRGSDTHAGLSPLSQPSNTCKLPSQSTDEACKHVNKVVEAQSCAYGALPQDCSSSTISKRLKEPDGRLKDANMSRQVRACPQSASSGDAILWHYRSEGVEELTAGAHRSICIVGRTPSVWRGGRGGGGRISFCGLGMEYRSKSDERTPAHTRGVLAAA
eukprot:5026790-Pleurochrysis_carterae.AAC.1